MTKEGDVKDDRVRLLDRTPRSTLEIRSGIGRPPKHGAVRPRAVRKADRRAGLRQECATELIQLTAPASR
jgi:hypothetical protein